MAKKKEDTVINIEITLEREDDDYQPSVVDVFAYNFLKTLSWWIGAIFILFPIGFIASLF